MGHPGPGVSAGPGKERAMTKDLGDIAILYVFLAYLWGALALVAVAWLGARMVKGAQARRLAKIMAEPEQPAPSADVAAVMREVAAAIQAAQLDLQAFSAGSDAERRARAAQVLAELEQVDALVGRLGALRPTTKAAYTPAVARLHSLAVQNGLQRAPPRA
jgi:hypothetical protein